MQLQKIADEIKNHQKKALELDMISKRYNKLTLEDAYEIQKMNIEKDLKTGTQFVGWKMGLTSLAKQKSVGVSQPIVGRLLESMRMSDDDLQLERFIHPRVEPEFAFLFNKNLEGMDVTEEEVWKATECIMPAIEVIDSRYRDFSFNLIDVVADNASSAKFLVSDKSYSPFQYHWEKIRVTMKLNDYTVQEGVGSDVMGHPVRSIIELVHMLHQSGNGIELGMIVLTGGITEAIHVSSRDVVTVEFEGLETLKLNVR
jgi:2-oxo-3-hexenedioate decarboxylase